MATRVLVPVEHRVWIARLAEGFSSILTSVSKAGYRRSGIALLGLFIPVAFMECALGAPPIAGPWNVLLFLDEAWRVVNGQVPQTDFYSPIGPMTALFTAIGMKIAPPSASSITYGVVLLAALVLPLVWRIAKDRLPWALALLCSILAGTYLLSPRPPAYGIRDTGYAMLYNRESYVLFLALCLCLFLKRRAPVWESDYFDRAFAKRHAPVRRSDCLDGAFAGLLLALLLYWKITYFVAAVEIAIASAFLIPKFREWYLAAGAAFAGVCAALFALLGISLPRYVANLVYAVKVQSPETRSHLLLASLNHNAMWMYLLFFCLALLSWTWSRSTRAPFAIARIWLVAASIILAVLFIESGNASQGEGLEDPLYFLTAVITFELFRRIEAEDVAKKGSSARIVYTASFALLWSLFFGSIMIGEAASYAYTVAWDVARRPYTPASQQFHSTQLIDFHVPSGTDHITGYWPARDLPGHINDGIDLLRRNLRSGESVTTLDFANPFSFALGIKPARDRVLFWDLHVTFDDKNPPSASEFLGNSSVVMVPRLLDRRTGFGFDTFDTMMALYGDYLHDHFHEVESTADWTMYRRN
ncbi:MAG: hypothetical protein ACLPH3_24250 [Terracidiphilus sp.]